MFWWGSHSFWISGLLNGVFWIVLIVVAVVLLKRELPHLGTRSNSSPALRLLEERYARGEISRDEFLHRRDVLLYGVPQPPPPVGETPAPPPSPSSPTDPTEPLPPPPAPGL
jgi:putative membrane protein